MGRESDEEMNRLSHKTGREKRRGSEKAGNKIKIKHKMTNKINHNLLHIGFTKSRSTSVYFN